MAEAPMSLRGEPTSIEVAEARALVSALSDLAVTVDAHTALLDAFLSVEEAHGSRVMPAVVPITLDDPAAAFARLHSLLPVIAGQDDVDPLEVALCHASVIQAERAWQR